MRIEVAGSASPSNEYSIRSSTWTELRIALRTKMTPPGRNRGYYSNKTFDDLVDLAFVEPNSEKRKALYNKAQVIIFGDLPTIPLWYEKQVAIVHKRVKNYSLPTTGNFSSLVDAYKEDNGN